MKNNVTVVVMVVISIYFDTVLRSICSWLQFHGNDVIHNVNYIESVPNYRQMTLTL